MNKKRGYRIGWTASLNGEMNEPISYSLFILSKVFGAGGHDLYTNKALSDQSRYISNLWSIDLTLHFQECL